VRPTLHYSVSREDYLSEHTPHTCPDYQQLLESGYKKAKLRAHSDMYWNTSVNEWAWSFTNDFDIMCEAKCKQVASINFYNQMTGSNISPYLADK